MNSNDFYTARLYDDLSERCWRLYRDLSDRFCGYEHLAKLLADAAIEFNEKFEKLLFDGKDSTI